MNCFINETFIRKLKLMPLTDETRYDSSSMFYILPYFASIFTTIGEKVLNFENKFSDNSHNKNKSYILVLVLGDIFAKLIHYSQFVTFVVKIRVGILRHREKATTIGWPC